MYLSCLEGELEYREKLEQAHDLAIAALLGDQIYNFGELLQHPILQVLDSTEYVYLKDMLIALNSGNHQAFELLLPVINKHSLLKENGELLRKKLCLMSLMEVISSNLSNTKLFSFEVVAKACFIDPDQVEFIVMKANSLGLIRAKIDECSKTINVEWIQSRILDQSQLKSLLNSFKNWKDKVQWTIDLFNANTRQFDNSKELII